jgi:hypothetical protein
MIMEHIRFCFAEAELIMPLYKSEEDLPYIKRTLILQWTCVGGVKCTLGRWMVNWIEGESEGWSFCLLIRNIYTSI